MAAGWEEGEHGFSEALSKQLHSLHLCVAVAVVPHLSDGM